MKNHSFRLLVVAASAALALPLFAASVQSDKLRERYVAGLAIIAETQAATTRMGHTLDLIEQGADGQTSRVASMESRLFGVDQSIKQLERRAQSLATNTKELLDQKTRIETRFAPLERTLKDDRSLLAKSTEAVAAVVASAEKSGSPVERNISDQMTAELKQHAATLRALADQLAQNRQRISLERTLFDGLQPHLATAGADLKSVATDLAATKDRVAKQRVALKDLQGSLDRDRASLAAPFASFGVAVENFRVTQVDVLRRWLMDGPPAGEVPALTIDDIVESSLPPPPIEGRAGSVIDPNAVGFAPESQMASRSMKAAPGGGGETGFNNQISAEFTQLSRRARWCLAMLERLEAFAEESLGEATAWTNAAANWRSELTAINRSVADLRGTLASLQMEQDMVASTIQLIARQAADTTGEVAATGRHIADQTTQLNGITADLKKRSAD